MKVLKTILYVLLILVAVFLVLMFVAPTRYQIERTVEIDAPKSLVVPQAIHFENFQQWNPWSKMDSNMVVTLKGVPGEVGSGYSWSGNKDVGKGAMEITGIRGDTFDIRLNFLEPVESEAMTYFIIRDDAGKTHVSWGMDTEWKRPSNVFGMVMGFRKAIEKDYDLGLASLKERAEKMKAEQLVDGYLIEEIEMSPRVYIGRRGTMGFDKLAEFYGTHFPAVATAAGKQGMEPVGAPSGIFFRWDTVAMQTDMAAVIPFAEGSRIEGFDVIPARGRTLMIDYYGPFEGTANAHYAMDKYMKAKGLSSNSLVIEEYMTDPMMEKDTAKWLTRIYYLVQ